MVIRYVNVYEYVVIVNDELVKMYFIVFVRIIINDVNVYMEGSVCLWKREFVRVMRSGVEEWNMMNVLILVCLRRFVLVKIVR